MEQNPELPNNLHDDDEIDLVELAKTIWEGRKAIIYSVAAFIAIGLFVALGTPEEYTSEVKLMPETQGEGSGIRLGGLAQRFGVGGAQATGEGIPPNLYPDVTNSLPLMQLLMEHKVYVERHDTTVTLSTYFAELNPSSPVSVAQKYTINLPFTVLGWITGMFTSDEPDTVEREEVLLDDPAPVVEIVRMNREQWEMIHSARERW